VQKTIISNRRLWAELYGVIQQVVWNDAAGVFLWLIVVPLVTNARIEGVVVLPNPLINFSAVTKS
jgi:hypothetical protein